MSKRRKAAPQPKVTLQINVDDDTLLESVARLLLSLTRPTTADESAIAAKPAKPTTGRPPRSRKRPPAKR